MYEIYKRTVLMFIRALPSPPGGGCGSGYRLYASRWRARIPALSLALAGLRPAPVKTPRSKHPKAN
jgi:hypothetical protein